MLTNVCKWYSFTIFVLIAVSLEELVRAYHTFQGGSKQKKRWRYLHLVKLVVSRAREEIGRTRFVLKGTFDGFLAGNGDAVVAHWMKEVDALPGSKDLLCPRVAKKLWYHLRTDWVLVGPETTLILENKIWLVHLEISKRKMIFCIPQKQG